MARGSERRSARRGHAESEFDERVAALHAEWEGKMDAAKAEAAAAAAKCRMGGGARHREVHSAAAETGDARERIERAERDVNNVLRCVGGRKGQRRERRNAAARLHEHLALLKERDELSRNLVDEVQEELLATSQRSSEQVEKWAQHGRSQRRSTRRSSRGSSSSSRMPRPAT